MSQENLEQFTKVYLRSPELQEKLKAMPDKESFVRLLVGLGEEGGYSFTAREVEEKMLAGMKTSPRELVSVGEAIDRTSEQDRSKRAMW